MDDFTICKDALSYFSFDLTQDLYDEGTNKSVKACISKLDQAKRKVQHESSWSFLIQQITLEQEEGENKMGYSYAFNLPTDLLRITKVYTKEPYQRIAGQILTNDPSIEVYGMLNNMPSNLPLDFEDLISLSLAFIIAPIISPLSNEVLEQVVKQYSWTVESLIKSDLATRSK